MEHQSNQPSAVTFSRTFDAPRELVFQMWTAPEHFASWWGPQGFSLQVAKMEVQPGGTFLGSQSSPDGNHVMWGKFVYQEVAAPAKLVFVQSFSDEHGHTIRAPFSANWPLEIRNEITLEEKEGKTTMTLQGGPINASAEEQAAYDGMAPMLQQGLDGTFDQLAAYLDSQK
ncbi:SRPBCC domain-containing protein [Cohnella ginsengisoli]|uniref:SRPBCC domain-containing protein n=1 Tax=Cohnella ginsengisoli TaxID=425004 RepID=A0A9X4KG01_9BACL|nr:SRPBCC domain-containing protein [Cohnella ginsengisoli]MDG0791291.1 SRPBCC domain-containing protein [Cohnella ginsengisoli]